jgi:hypothetical protein
VRSEKPIAALVCGETRGNQSGIVAARVTPHHFPPPRIRQSRWPREARQKGVPVEGLEPTLTCVKQILSLSRLPFRHTGLAANQRLAELTPIPSTGMFHGNDPFP